MDGTPFYVECKVGKRPDIRAALRQAIHKRDGEQAHPPMVVSKQDRGDTLVTLRLDDFLSLLKGREE